ncbi:putative vegetatible incompatibility protein HET-E-1 [Fimbriiglobus ruber]|uniref:Putative vegetatible incompatibility protein HET-E-1 n=1 Tax=Fimbriiglobus ruber TaxID=1908690 RepID=A0A225E0V2_9BACT|nr:putative vegetatible incompatibility protein HET-E-1 [Fimbriiglobus ruber]
MSLDVRPATINLDGPFAYSQLLVTAKLSTGEAVDATRVARIAAPAIATVAASGSVRPVADGSGTLTISVGDKSATVAVTVTGQKSAHPVSFVKDVQPVLSKTGCNAGTCHGAQAGKNGFKLSLRGYDPVYDFRALTDDLEGRRFNRAAPERSLMLMKPAGAVPHVGGVLMSPGEPYYELLRRWIAEGVKVDLTAPRVTGIEIFPKDPTVGRIGARQQFAVLATYADGKKRDVSAEAFIDSSNTDVATIDKTGLLTTVRRGEATMLARYEGSYSASTVVVTGDRSGFAWTAPPQLNWIDELVDAKLKKVKILPSGICDDADFVRRVSIDLTGVPPTAAEVRAFLADARPTREKREALVDKLVGSEAFVEHWTNKWADLLQVNRKFLGDPGAAALQKWIRDAVTTDMPYDKFAYSVLTASGSNVDNPPAAYYKTLRDPDAVMENTTQLFLAIRFNCNKCHDHPFERWTQDQYYEMAAYFAQVNRTEDPKFKGQRIGGTAVEGAKPLVEVIADGKGGDVKHARTGSVVAPKFPYSFASTTVSTEPRRVQVAKWITSKDNPYFAKSWTNRIWSYLLGVGIIEPVDDIRAGNPATNPELLDRLTKEFVASGFDTRKLIKTICKSRTYQLAIATNPFNKDDDINYSHALPRRLPAEVLFDSIHRATGSESRLPGMPAGARAAQLLDSNVDLPGGFLELFGKPVRESACECERSNTMMLGSVMAMVNGPIVASAVNDPNSHISKFTAATKDDGKVVEEIYFSILNRAPTAAESASGVKALNSAAPDFTRLVAEHNKKVEAFKAYQATVDGRQAAWEDGLRAQKPTAWTVLDPVTVKAASGASFDVGDDGTLLLHGGTTTNELYTIGAESKLKGVTAVRLEVFSDPRLPANGPGRAKNGNFVLNEFRATHRPAKKPTEKPKPVKFAGAQATYEQGNFGINNAIDNNPATGWAISPQTGRDQVAIFPVQGAGVGAGDDGTLFSFVLDQRFGTNHTIGKFRLSVTTDKNAKLKAPVTHELAEMLDTPTKGRKPEVAAKLRQMYLAQDAEYQRLQRDASVPAPADARVLGAQDLVWALINSPAFLFNR